MVRLLALSLILGISALFAPRSNAQFSNCATSGENNSTFAIQEANLNGSPLPNGSQIAIYGGANNQCGGKGTWNGGTLAISVWEDDGNNNGGLEVGESLVFKVWDTTTTQEDVSVDYASGPHINCDTGGTYRSNALCTIASIDVTAIPPPPPSPILSSPSDGATGVSVDPTLAWNASSDADSYDLQLATDAGFSNLIVDQSGLSSTSRAVSGLDHQTTYYWRVRAANAGGESPWSSAFDFTTEDAPVTPPLAPTLSSPSDGATGVSVDPTLAWNAASGATSYDLQLATDAGFSNLVVDQSGLSSTSRAVSGLDHQTTYHWRARAVNAVGASPWSSAFDFTTEDPPVTPPAAPILSSPANGTTGVSVAPTLAWNASSGADSYDLQLATDAGFSNLVVNQSGLSSTSRAVSGLDHVTPYHWRVRASNAGGESPWSSAFDFTTEEASAPQAPTLSSPSNGATGVSTDPRLAWDAASGADSYDLQLATDAGFSNLVVDQNGLGGTSHAVSELDHETTYHWRVRAVNAVGEGPWSSAFEFTTKEPPLPPPPAPTLSSPSDGATDVSTGPTLSWDASSSTDSYDLQVATDAGFSNLVVDQDGLSSTSRAVSGLSHTTQYHWRVRASNTGGESSWSAAFDFTTEDPPAPAAPTLTNPADESTDVSVDLTLVWNAASGATSYDLQLATDAGFSNLVVDQAGLTTTSHAVSGLDHATQHYWRVRAANVGGESPWSSAFDFTTVVAAPAAPTLSSPSDGTTDVSTDPTLAWNASADVASYRVQVDAGFSNLVVDQAGVTDTSFQVTGLDHAAPYHWRVQASNASGTSPWSTVFDFITAEEETPTLSEPPVEVPTQFMLSPNYPNPFNPVTTIEYTVPRVENVILTVHNALGQIVATLVAGRQEIGGHRVTFDASNLPSGVYHYRLRAGVFTATRKMVLLK